MKFWYSVFVLDRVQSLLLDESLTLANLGNDHGLIGLLGNPKAKP